MFFARSSVAVVLAAAGLVGGCTAEGADASEGEGSAAVVSAPTADVTALRKLIDRGATMIDDVTRLPERAQTIDSQKTDDLGVVNVDALVQATIVILPTSHGSFGTIIQGVVFNRITIDGSMGTHGGAGAHFSEESRTLVLDEAGLKLAQAAAYQTEVHGARLAQLQEVFARTPHPSAPNELKWGENPFFRLYNGDEAVAFNGHLYAHKSDGSIVRYTLAADVDDPLDQ